MIVLLSLICHLFKPNSVQNRFLNVMVCHSIQNQQNNLHNNNAALWRSKMNTKFQPLVPLSTPVTCPPQSLLALF